MSSTTTPLAEISASQISLQIFGALLLIVITIYLCKVVIQRSRSLVSRNQSRSLAIVETLILGPREKLIVVQINQQQIVVGVTAQSINHLYTLPEHPAAITDTTQDTNTPSFRQRLSQICAGKIEK